MARKSRKITTASDSTHADLYIRTALYVRASVEDKRNRGQSVENQQLILKDYLADKPEFLICGTYIDDGATGTNFKRPAFQQMLTDIEAGNINCVVVKDLSRLGRNAIDTGYYIERYFQEHKVRFIAITDQFDSAEPNNLSGGIMLPLKNMVNEAYSLDIGRKIKAQARQAMKDGAFLGRSAPYGYRKDPEDCHKLLIDEAAAPVVHQIFQWAYEQVAVNDIVRRLNQQGVPAPSHYKKAIGEIAHVNLLGKGTWQTWTVIKILESEVYTGDLVQGKTKTVDHRQVRAGPDNLIVARNTHQAIVSRDVFETVLAFRQQVRDAYKAKDTRQYTPNIFKGKVFCAHCGGGLHRQRSARKKGPDVYVFLCLTSSRIAKDSCVGILIREDRMMTAVVDALRAELAVVLGNWSKVCLETAQQQAARATIQSSISKCQQQIDSGRHFIRGLYENFVQGTLTSEEYFFLKAGYEAKISTAVNHVARLEKSLAAMDAQLARYQELKREAKRLETAPELTAALVDSLIDRIDINHDKEIRVTFRFQSEFEEYSEVMKQCANM